MKTTFFILMAIFFHSLVTSANEIVNPADTVINYRGKSITISEKDEIIRIANIENQMFDHISSQMGEQESKIKQDGSNFKFVFSWENRNKRQSRDLNAHWEGFGIGLLNLANLEDADLKREKSYNIILNLMDYNISLDGEHWLMVTGLGIDWSRYHFQGNKALTSIDGLSQFVDDPQGRQYKSSKWLTYHLTVPLLLEYQTKLQDRHDFYISAGMVAYLRCYSKSQVEYEISGNKIKENMGRSLNLVPLSARLWFQVGIGSVRFYTNYAPWPLFEKNKGPKIYPLGMGVIFDM